MPAQPSNGQGKANISEGSNGKGPSKHKIVKDGWGGSRSNFQASYGLKMTQEDLQEGNAIMEAFQNANRDYQQGKK